MISILEKRLENLEREVDHIKSLWTTEDSKWKNHVERLVIEYFGRNIKEELKLSNFDDIEPSYRSQRMSNEIERDTRDSDVWSYENDEENRSTRKRKRQRMSFGLLNDSDDDDVKYYGRSLIVEYNHSVTPSQSRHVCRCEDSSNNEFTSSSHIEMEFCGQEGSGVSNKPLNQRIYDGDDQTVKDRERGRFVSKRLNFESHNYQYSKDNHVEKSKEDNVDQQLFSSSLLRLEENLNVSSGSNGFFSPSSVQNYPMEPEENSNTKRHEDTSHFTSLLVKNPKFQCTSPISDESQINCSSSVNQLNVTSRNENANTINLKLDESESNFTSLGGSNLSSPINNCTSLPDNKNYDIINMDSQISEGKRRTRKLHQVKAHHGKMLKLYGFRSHKDEVAKKIMNDKSKTNGETLKRAVSSNSIASTKSGGTLTDNLALKESTCTDAKMSKTKLKKLQKSVARAKYRGKPKKTVRKVIELEKITNQNEDVGGDATVACNLLCNKSNKFQNLLPGARDEVET